MLVLLQNKKTH